MKQIKVYYLFYFVAVVVILVGLNDPDSTSDINIHDTYFVIPNLYFATLISAAYLFLGLGYWFFCKILKRNLLNFLTLIHSFILIGGFLLYWIIYFICQHGNPNPFQQIRRAELMNMTLVINTILIVLVAQPIYVFNLLWSLKKKNRNSAIR